MGDAAAAAAEAAARRLRAHQLSMEKHFAAPVEVLKADEHADYPRWHDAIIHRVQQFPGALAALNDVVTITPVPAPPAMGEAQGLTAAQFFQQPRQNSPEGTWDGESMGSNATKRYDRSGL